MKKEYIKDEIGRIKHIIGYEQNFILGEDEKIYKCSYYENGQKHIEERLKWGLPHGKFQSWFKDGQIESEGEYKEGKKVGRWVSWHGNGQKKSEGNYKNGERIGYWLYLYSDGTIESEVEYRKNKIIIEKNLSLTA